MTDIDYESEIKKAEVNRIQAEIARIDSEREKFEEEKAELIRQRSRKWWNIRASGLIQSAIAGIVAGALVAGFGLDHFLKVSELNEKSQKALEIEKDEIEGEKKTLEEESRQAITSLRNENRQLKVKVENALQEVANLASTPSQCAEDYLSKELASLKNELQRVKSEAESREKRLSGDLSNLVQEHEVTAKGVEGTWFPIIASPYNKTDLLGKLEELERLTLKYPVHVYETADRHGVPVYAITLGGYLSKAEASDRVSYARSSGIASDAYAWSSNIWGKNIVSQIQ